MDSDKAPFLVTLALAIAGWSATYIVGRITNSPTLEYEISQPSASPTPTHPDAKNLTIQLTNLTRATTLKNLTVVFIAQGNTKILGELTEMQPIPPAFEGNDPWKHRGGLAQYTIPKVHPGWKFSVRVGYVGDKPPTLRLESEDPIYSTAPSWETWFVRYEVWVFVGMALWLFVSVVFYFWPWRRKATRQ